MSEVGDTQYGDCSSCRKKIAYRVRLEGTEVKVSATHVDPMDNLDCSKPFPKGQEIAGQEDPAVHPVQVIYVGLLYAIPPGNDDFEFDKDFGEQVRKWGFAQAGHITTNLVDNVAQLPERVIPLKNCPPGTRYISVNGPVFPK